MPHLNYEIRALRPASQKQEITTLHDKTEATQWVEKRSTLHLLTDGDRY